MSEGTETIKNLPLKRARHLRELVTVMSLRKIPREFDEFEPISFGPVQDELDW